MSRKPTAKRAAKPTAPTTPKGTKKRSPKTKPAPPPAPAPAAPTAAENYGRHREAARARNAAKSVAGRDIGAIPPVANPERRAAAERNFRAFLLSYFPWSFRKAFSRDHDMVIAAVDEAVLEGGLQAIAMPRGSGKTTICERAVLYAALNGHRQFPVLIGPDLASALARLDTVKTELEVNPLLAQDYPEVCKPIAFLEGITNRCRGQTCQGEPTRILWKADRLVLPTIAGSKASATVIRVCGLTGQIRGLKYLRPDGRDVRPDLVLIDDAQTRESARSPIQSGERAAIIAGDVLGMAGPGEKIAALMPCTVIQQGDMADKILDRKAHPEWRGVRTKICYSFPTDDAKWSTYAETLAESQRTGKGMAEATAYYAANRAAMDAGADVPWAERFEPGELSAIQHVMNLRLERGEAAFAAEFQNEPLSLVAIPDELTATAIQEKLSGVPLGKVPLAASRLTAFIDVQQRILFYVVCAWEENFSGAVLDYGTYPDQKRSIFTLRDAKYDLAGATKVEGVEAQIHAGLATLTGVLLGREWPREDGAAMRIDRCFVDANWQSDTIRQFIRRSPFAGVLTPTHGKYVGAAKAPLTDRKIDEKNGERAGLNWIQPALKVRGKVRHVYYDTNFWKSFVYARLATATGAPGCLALYGDKAAAHYLFAKHLTAEFRERTEGRGRHLDEWAERPGKPDNHWFDCLVGAAVAANYAGVNLREVAKAAGASRPRRGLSFEELRRLAEERSRPATEGA